MGLLSLGTLLFCSTMPVIKLRKNFFSFIGKASELLEFIWIMMVM